MSFKGFTTVELMSPKKSLFDKTHNKRVSTRMGRLTPVLIEECIPGDKWNGSSEILLRLAPMAAPIYDDIQLFVHYYFVPYRLLWEDWEEFITGGRLGVGIDPTEAPIPPFFDIGDAFETTAWDESQLADYLGVPDFKALGTQVNYTGLGIDLMPFLAYFLVWYEYYRDRNYDQDVDYLPAHSGEWPVDEILTSIIGIKTRDYLKDYFTSALPFTQRGEEVLMPLEGTGSVTYLNQSLVKQAGDGSPAGGALSANAGALEAAGNPPGLEASRLENIDEVLLTASSVSMNDFRSAYALQVWLERNAIGGSRYTESIQAHFAVKPQDSRLQRPEFLGGGRIQVRINEVVTSAFSQNEADATVPAANLLGHGVSYGNTNRFRYFCPEHGFIIGIASIMTPGSYQQGLPRMFYHRRSFLDYVWPTFAKLGEQPVDKAELYASSANLAEDENGERALFGYQSRYADWKYTPNTNHGAFRTSLLFWSLTRTFADSPVLGADFVRFDDSTQDRIFLVNGSEDNFWMYIQNRLTVVRALPYFGTPNTLGFH